MSDAAPVPSAVGTCPASPSHCSFLPMSYSLRLNSGLSSKRKHPVMPMMPQWRSLCKILRDFFLRWHLYAILEFISAQAFASKFCSVESLRKVNCCHSMLVTPCHSVAIAYQIMCNKYKSARCAFADIGMWIISQESIGLYSLIELSYMFLSFIVCPPKTNYTQESDHISRFMCGAGMVTQWVRPLSAPAWRLEFKSQPSMEKDGCGSIIPWPQCCGEVEDLWASWPPA